MFIVCDQSNCRISDVLKFKPPKQVENIEPDWNTASHRIQTLCIFFILQIGQWHGNGPVSYPPLLPGHERWVLAKPPYIVDYLCLIDLGQSDAHTWLRSWLSEITFCQISISWPAPRLWPLRWQGHKGVAEAIRIGFVVGVWGLHYGNYTPWTFKVYKDGRQSDKCINSSKAPLDWCCFLCHKSLHAQIASYNGSILLCHPAPVAHKLLRQHRRGRAYPWGLGCSWRGGQTSVIEAWLTKINPMPRRSCMLCMEDRAKDVQVPTNTHLV